MRNFHESRSIPICTRLMCQAVFQSIQNIFYWESYLKSLHSSTVFEFTKFNDSILYEVV